MTDDTARIVANLRRPTEHADSCRFDERQFCSCLMSFGGPKWSVTEEAADEIERLAEEVELLRLWLTAAAWDELRIPADRIAAVSANDELIRWESPTTGETVFQRRALGGDE